ncbi:DM9 repeat-containing protein [Agarilytica rhodophyticola]|uniref:DM9 repeat-containing protein n=1 Tax=Agarilytica rhodophyticola TaxID=1737490 RepID=UPI000CD90DDF|nr:DM9 repeat-containing protein [Agarilytica rhodophyticola]
MKLKSLLLTVLFSLFGHNQANAYSDPNSWVYGGGWLDISPSQFPNHSLVQSNRQNSNSPVYVCQYANIPGTRSGDTCYVPYRGREESSKSFLSLEHRLISGGLRWEKRLHGPYVRGALPNKIRNDAVIGGNEGGRDTYICASLYYSDNVIGKFVRGHGCYLPYRGREHLYKVSDDNFSVLIDPTISDTSAK